MDIRSCSVPNRNRHGLFLDPVSPLLFFGTTDFRAIKTEHSARRCQQNKEVTAAEAGFGVYTRRQGDVLVIHDAQEEFAIVPVFRKSDKIKAHLVSFCPRGLY
jgi:hypothetical protein